MSKTNMKQILSLFILSITFSSLTAQIGGENTYQFLNLNSSARVASLGGNQIAVKDNDPFLAADNPSLLNSKMSNKLAFTYLNYLADVSSGYVSYTKHYDSLGTFNLGIQYVDYGTFDETDEGGNNLGTFTAGEYAFVMGYGREIDSNFSVGANLKTIYSSFYDYNSLGLAADLGITYYNSRRQITLALVGKNMGTQLQTYTDDNNESLPFDLQLGFSKRLAKVPLRFSVIAHQLHNWDLTYTNPAQEIAEESILGNESDTEKKSNDGFFENLGRHMIFNTEFLISENFNIRLGYNYLRRAELRIDEKLGTVGISWGFGMRISKFHISYGRSAYHQAGATNTFSVSTRLSDFIK
jgi:hypothetical protein